MNDLHEEPIKSVPPTRRWPAIGILTTIIVVSAVSVLWVWWTYYQPYESTENAHIAGYVIPVSTVVPGSVVAIHVENTMHVEEGQLLVQLDRQP